MRSYVIVWCSFIDNYRFLGQNKIKKLRGLFYYFLYCSTRTTYKQRVVVLHLLFRDCVEMNNNVDNSVKHKLIIVQGPTNM